MSLDHEDEFSVDDSPPEPQHCFACGQLGPEELGQPCSDCAQKPLEDWAEMVHLIRRDIKELDKRAGWAGAQVKRLLGSPQSLYCGELEVVWRSYERANINLRRLRSEQPALCQAYSETVQVDQLFVNALRM